MTPWIRPWKPRWELLQKTLVSQRERAAESPYVLGLLDFNRCMFVDKAHRFMPRRRSANNVIARLKLLSGSDERSISSSWKRPFEFMKLIYTTCRLPTVVLQTNVSC
jgi:hypothetical protein